MLRHPSRPVSHREENQETTLHFVIVPTHLLWRQENYSFGLLKNFLIFFDIRLCPEKKKREKHSSL